MVVRMASDTVRHRFLGIKLNEKYKAEKLKSFSCGPFRGTVENMVRDELKRLLAKASGVAEDAITIVATEHTSHGDYASNLAMTLAATRGEAPRAIAEEIIAKLPTSPLLERVELAGPGFVNFFLTDQAIACELESVIEQGEAYGKGTLYSGKRMMYEYTDPNPFKVFHIGHLMSNAIGESLARLAEAQSAIVLRANYQGDVGLHVAKALYGMQEERASMPSESDSPSQKSEWLGAAYVLGAKAYEDDESAKVSIVELNKKIFEDSDPELRNLYAMGRRWSLAHFEELYKLLGTTFDYSFFESEVAPLGAEIVQKFLLQGIFEKSDGAIIFDGEKYGLHKRVFINSQGIPTYEAKDLGLQTLKFEKEPTLDRSVVITANEQNGYFTVVLKALSQFSPIISEKTLHVGHGMMLGPGGKKMSSRKGGVISGEGLLEEIIDEAQVRIATGKFHLSDEEKRIAAERIAIAAIKYSILRQGSAKNIIFDREQALSFEGESGPYLLYTYARAQSLLRKGREEGFEPVAQLSLAKEPLAHILLHFPEVVVEATKNFSPNTVAQYLLHLAQEMNTYYGKVQIVVTGDRETAQRLALVFAVAQVLKNGLTILCILVLEKM